MKKCLYCEREFKNGQSYGGHIRTCKFNPNLDSIKKKVSEKLKGDNNPAKRKNVREKISNTIKNKIKEGTWHNSFSKSRTHLYKNIKFHGKWELEYAKYLDENNVKWRRPTEKFEYLFEGKKRKYTPDFYLINENIYIEIKGYKTSKDIAKWEQFPLKLKILRGKDLFKIGRKR